MDEDSTNHPLPETGLSATEAARRLAEDGPNALGYQLG